MGLEAVFAREGLAAGLAWRILLHVRSRLLFLCFLFQ